MKKNISKFSLLIIAIIVALIFFKGWNYRKEIDENRKTTVCQFVFCKKYPKTSSSYFEYYVNGKLYREEYGKCPENYEEKIGKYMQFCEKIKA